MSGERFKDYNWQLRREAGGGVTYKAIHAALLMDIRDELKRLNSLLYCANFTGIPAELRAIRQNTAKPKRKPKKKAGP